MEVLYSKRLEIQGDVVSKAEIPIKAKNNIQICPINMVVVTIIEPTEWNMSD